MRLASGLPTEVTAITRRGPPETVFNIEVHGEHAYYVGADGVLVHNSCSWLKNLGDVPDATNKEIVNATVMRQFLKDGGKYVDETGDALNGQYKAIVSIDDEFRMAPSMAGSHPEIAAFTTKRGSTTVKAAGSFWFSKGRLIGADITSGHYQPLVGGGYADLLDILAREHGSYRGIKILDEYR